MIAMIGKINEMGTHLNRPVKLDGEDLVLHYFGKGLSVRGGYVSLPRELTRDLEYRLHELVGKVDGGFKSGTLEGSFLLEKPGTAWHTAIQFHGRWCRISDSFELPHATRGGDNSQQD